MGERGLQDEDAGRGEHRVWLDRPKSARSGARSRSYSPLRTANRATYLLGGLSMIFVLGVVRIYSSAGSSLATDDVTTSWVAPAGFVDYRSTKGGGVATQWDKPTRADCRGDRATCFVINVVTENDCSFGLYVSITYLNASGQRTGWTAETAQGVRSRERARLVFNSYDPGVVAARIAEIRCS